LPRMQPIRGRSQQQRQLGVGVRRPHVIDLDDLAVLLDHDLHSHRAGGGPHPPQEPRCHLGRLSTTQPLVTRTDVLPDRRSCGRARRRRASHSAPMRNDRGCT
jgi:hypothetical protein